MVSAEGAARFQGEKLAAVAGGGVAVVTGDDALSDRIARTLASESVGLLDRTGDVDDLHPRAAHATLLLATLAGVGEQRRLIKVAARRFPEAPAIVIAPPSQTAVRRALEAGASGYVAVAELEQALVATIRAAAAGQVSVPRELRRHAVRPALSHREKQTLALLVSGLTNREIADRLYLAESTVKTHVTAVFGKLGVGSRSEAAALVLDPAQNLGGALVAPRTGNGAPRADVYASRG